MLSEDRALGLIKDAVTSLQRSGLLDPGLTFDAGTVLLGSGSALDSIAFVTFMTELEDRMQGEIQTGDSVFSLILDDLHSFNPDQAGLSAQTLARYMMKMSEQKVGNE